MLPKIIEKWQSTIQERPLSLSLNRNHSGVAWSFAPYMDNNYSVILLPHGFAFTNVFPRGVYRGNLPPMTFVLKYHSGQGWVAYSDKLSWPPPKSQSLTWSRVD
jgi:hypothetical protein